MATNLRTCPRSSQNCLLTTKGPEQCSLVEICQYWWFLTCLLLRRKLERRLELCVTFQDWIIPILATGVLHTHLNFESSSNILLIRFLKFLLNHRYLGSESFPDTLLICFLIFLLHQFSLWPSAPLASLSTTLILNTQTSVEIELTKVSLHQLNEKVLGGMFNIVSSISLEFAKHVTIC